MKLSQNFILAIILSGTLLSFANTLSHDFTNWDDDKYITQNERIRDLSASGIGAIFSSLDINLYTPLATMSFAVDYALWGLNPAGYHAVNLLLHLLNTWLVFRFFMRLSGSAIAAGVGACLFGVHPIHVESVAWIAERKDLLFTAFGICSLLLYSACRDHPEKRLRLVASAFMFLCSLLVKPQALALPAVMLLMDYFRDGALDLRQTWKRLWPFAGLAALFIGLTLYLSVLRHSGAVHTFTCSLWNRPFLVTYGICFYIVKLLWPFHLTAFYECPHEIRGLLPSIYYLSALGVAGLFWTIWRLGRHWRDLTFGVFFFLFTLLPVLQIIPFGHVIVAERYAYMPSIGMCFLAGQVVALSVKRRPALRYGLGAMVLFVVLGLAFLTCERNKAWANSITLFNNIIKKNPNIAIAYNNRGVARHQQGDYDGANRDYTEAIRLDRKYVNAFFNRGIVRAQKQDVSGALRDYDTALALDPRYAAAYYNRGLLLDSRGDTNGALRDLTDAILINPKFDAAFTSRGALRAKMGQYDKALADFRQAIQLNPTNAIAYCNQGKIYLTLSNSAAALAFFKEAYRLGLQSTTRPAANTHQR